VSSLWAIALELLHESPGDRRAAAPARNEKLLSALWIIQGANRLPVVRLIQLNARPDTPAAMEPPRVTAQRRERNLPSPSGLPERAR
jgi:hypothetical protein